MLLVLYLKLVQTSSKLLDIDFSIESIYHHMCTLLAFMSELYGLDLHFTELQLKA